MTGGSGAPAGTDQSDKAARSPQRTSNYFASWSNVRGLPQKASQTVDFDDDVSQLDGWAKYFERLSTAKTLPHVYTNYYKDM